MFYLILFMCKNILLSSILLVSIGMSQLSSNVLNAIELGDASLVGTSGAEWEVVVDTSAVGGSYLATEAIGLDESTEISLTVAGGSVVSFDWRTDSEEFSGEFTFAIDGVDQETISGRNDDWMTQSYVLAGGTRTLTWTFALDSDAFESDRGYLDNVFIDGVSPAALLAQEYLNGHVNSPYHLNLQSNYEDAEVSILSGALPTGLELDNGVLVGTPLVAGDFTFTLSVSSEGVPSSESELTVSIAETELGQFSGLGLGSSIMMASGSNWYLDSESALRPGVIAGGESTGIMIPMYGPSVLEFDWKVDSTEGFDFLTVSLDGVAQEAISGYTDWARVSVVIPAGYHEVTVSYARDELVEAQGEDAGYLDNVTVTGYMNAVATARAEAYISPEQDADRDGGENLWEYLLGTSPVDLAERAVITPARSSGILTLPLADGSRVDEVQLKAYSTVDLQSVTEYSVAYSSENAQLEALIPDSGEEKEYYYYSVSLE